MYIARILYPVQVLGPGKRVGIWFVGCKHKCKGCSNPELWNINETSYVTIEQVEKLIRNVISEFGVSFNSYKRNVGLIESDIDLTQ